MVKTSERWLASPKKRLSAPDANAMRRASADSATWADDGVVGVAAVARSGRSLDRAALEVEQVELRRAGHLANVSDEPQRSQQEPACAP